MYTIELSTLHKNSLFSFEGEMVYLTKIEDGVISFKTVKGNYKEGISIENLNSLKPVKITDEILKGLGFDFKQFPSSINYYYYKENFYIDRWAGVFSINMIEPFQELYSNLKYIHEIQAIFYKEINWMPSLPIKD